MIKAIIQLLVKEYLNKISFEEKIRAEIEIQIQDAIRKCEIRKTIFSTIEEEINKSIKFWNSGSGETRTVVRDIVSSEILQAIKYILTNNVTLDKIEKMRSQDIKNLLSKR